MKKTDFSLPVIVSVNPLFAGVFYFTILLKVRETLMISMVSVSVSTGSSFILLISTDLVIMSALIFYILKAWDFSQDVEEHTVYSSVVIHF